MILTKYQIAINYRLAAVALGFKQSQLQELKELGSIRSSVNHTYCC